MRNSLTSSILILFVLTIMGCTSIDSSHSNFNKYYEHIEKGRKLAFVENNYSEALEHYKLAFQQVENPFGLDFIDALEISSVEQDLEFGKTILEEISKRGCPMKLAKEYAQKFSILNDKKWVEFAKNYPTYQMHFKNNYNLALRAELLDLRTLDSTFNIEFHRAPLDSLYAIKTSIEKRNILLQFEASGNFPSESNVGVFYDDNTILGSPISTILIHQYQEGDTVFLNRLPEFIEQGCLDKSGNIFNEYVSSPPIGISKTFRSLQLQKWHNAVEGKGVKVEFINVAK